MSRLSHTVFQDSQTSFYCFQKLTHTHRQTFIISVSHMYAQIRALWTRVNLTDSELKKVQSAVRTLSSAGFVKKCRICFKEVEGSSQCQGIRRTCSEWSDMSSPQWTDPFRDDTDHKPGGCTYQWRVQCL